MGFLKVVYCANTIFHGFKDAINVAEMPGLAHLFVFGCTIKWVKNYEKIYIACLMEINSNIDIITCLSILSIFRRVLCDILLSDNFYESRFLCPKTRVRVWKVF